MFLFKGFNRKVEAFFNCYVSVAERFKHLTVNQGHAGSSPVGYAIIYATLAKRLCDGSVIH